MLQGNPADLDRQPRQRLGHQYHRQLERRRHQFTTGSSVAFDDLPPAAHSNPIPFAARFRSGVAIVVYGSGTGAGGQDFTFSGGAITVNTSITKNQAGSVTFNDNVTTPTTIISAGGFTVGAASTYISSTKLDLNGGTLSVNGTLNTALTVKSGVLNVSSGGLLGGGAPEQSGAYPSASRPSFGGHFRPR